MRENIDLQLESKDYKECQEEGSSGLHTETKSYSCPLMEQMSSYLNWKYANLDFKQFQRIKIILTIDGFCCIEYIVNQLYLIWMAVCLERSNRANRFTRLRCVYQMYILVLRPKAVWLDCHWIFDRKGCCHKYREFCIDKWIVESEWSWQCSADEFNRLGLAYDGAGICTQQLTAL